MQRSKPELMSPAGHWPQLKAAIAAGADAVYFGLQHFSARAKVGFEESELPQVMDTLHERGVKGFVTFNTLVFDTELQEAEKAIADIAKAGADAIIVQDVGVANLARQIAPDLEIHGSTQMSITSAQGAALAKHFGCSRVVLGRELSLRDIEKIAEDTDVELEVFVHGALCVSYSGQCFSSEAWGGRSANRGQCAQACRLSYDLIVDGKKFDVGPYNYLLSPQDLYALNQVGDLMKLGISCLKIEGRYKDANYVALTTSAYRQAIDAAFKNQEIEDEPRLKQQLTQVYSRGLEPAFISGTNHQNVVDGRAPRHRGLRVGEVVSVGNSFVDVIAEVEISAGDGIVFDASERRSPDEPEEGGNIFEIANLPKKNGFRLKFAHDAIDFSRIADGDILWRTNDPRLNRELKNLAQAKVTGYTRAIDFRVVMRLNEPLIVYATIDEGLLVTCETISRLQVAERRAIDRQLLESQLGRLGNTPFHLGTLEIESDDSGVELFIPMSELNELRRKLVDELIAKRKSLPTPRIERGVVKAAVTSTEVDPSQNDVPVQLHLLVRSVEQLEAAIELRPASITLDYLDLFGLKPSVEKVREANIVCRVASPRILKPSEQKIIRFLVGLECELLVRSGGLLFDLLNLPESHRPTLIGDFSLNVANVVSAQTMLDLGLRSITPTYDLNGKQIVGLLDQIPSEKIELIIYSHLPVFHTEHCVFCRFISDGGTDKSNCGQPCEHHQVHLSDKRGRLHPVMADVGCRNTVFGAESQFSAKHLSQWISAGFRSLRMEFVHETASEILESVFLTKEFIAGKMSEQELDRSMKSHSTAAVTEGSFFVPLSDLK